MGNKPLRHSVACCCGRHPLRRVAWFLPPPLPPHPIAVYTSSAQLHIQGVAHSLWQPSFCLFCKSVLSWRIKKYSWKNIPKNDNFLIILLNPLGVIPILYNTKYKISFWNIYVFCVLTEVETNFKQHKSENFHFFVNCTFKKIVIIFQKY